MDKLPSPVCWSTTIHIFILCFDCLMVFNTTFTIFQLYRGGQFYWWRKPEDLKKTTDLSQVTDRQVLIGITRWKYIYLCLELGTFNL